MSKIASDNSIGKCLFEARKIESLIKQRKLLSIKTDVSYDAIGTYSGNKRYRSNGKAEVRAMAMAEATDLRVITVVIAKSVEINTLLESALIMISSATNAMVKTILVEYVILRPGHKVLTKVMCQSRSKGRPKSKNFNEVEQSDSDNVGQYDDYDDTKLQEYDNDETLYYHDVVIHSNEQVKCRFMYYLKMNLGNNSCLNKCKVDTGADDNLLPIGVYKHLGGKTN